MGAASSRTPDLPTTPPGVPASLPPAPTAAAAGVMRPQPLPAPSQPAPSPPPRTGYVAAAREGYEAIIAAIIRPQRATYALDELGPPAFTFRGRRFERSDFTVVNPRGLRIECSWWQPAAADRPTPELPVVLYIHGNSSCRLAVQECLEPLLAEGVTVAALDCAGSGRSEGDYVSLGWHERDDVAAVVAHLRRSGAVSAVALWGRSMGAATALLHCHRDPSIAGAVLDSAFTDLRTLARELVQDGAAREGYRCGAGWRGGEVGAGEEVGGGVAWAARSPHSGLSTATSSTRATVPAFSAAAAATTAAASLILSSPPRSRLCARPCASARASTSTPCARSATWSGRSCPRCVTLRAAASVLQSAARDASCACAVISNGA